MNISFRWTDENGNHTFDFAPFDMQAKKNLASILSEAHIVCDIVIVTSDPNDVAHTLTVLGGEIPNKFDDRCLVPSYIYRIIHNILHDAA